MITKKSKYGLKALLFLARHQELIHISELSKSENIPQKFLEGILVELKNKGLLFSKRGKDGGYKLIKAPGQITFWQIIRILDGPLAPITCVSETAYHKCEECIEDEETCLVRRIMKKVRDRTATILDNTTLDDQFNEEKYENNFL